MVSWGWIPISFIFGIIAGMFFLALVSAGRDK